MGHEDTRRPDLKFNPDDHVDYVVAAVTAHITCVTELNELAVNHPENPVSQELMNTTRETAQIMAYQTGEDPEKLFRKLSSFLFIPPASIYVSPGEYAVLNRANGGRLREYGSKDHMKLVAVHFESQKILQLVVHMTPEPEDKNNSNFLQKNILSLLSIVEPTFLEKVERPMTRSPISIRDQYKNAYEKKDASFINFLGNFERALSLPSALERERALKKLNERLKLLAFKKIIDRNISPRRSS